MRKILLFALLPFVLGSSPAAASDLTQLVGTVGPGFTIDLVDANGKHVDVLTEGRYEFVVHDLSDVHNFALGNQTTNTRLFTGGIEFVGDETFTLDLAPGSYAYACSAHPDTMNGRFRVIAAAPPPVATKTLSAKVTSGAVSLSAKAVTAGPYKLTVADRSRSRNFHVVGPGVNRRTGKNVHGQRDVAARAGGGQVQVRQRPATDRPARRPRRLSGLLRRGGEERHERVERALGQ